MFKKSFNSDCPILRTCPVLHNESNRRRYYLSKQKQYLIVAENCNEEE